MTLKLDQTSRNGASLVCSGTLDYLLLDWLAGELEKINVDCASCQQEN